MPSCLGHHSEWPFPSQADESEKDVEDLQYWDWLYSSIEVFRGKVPEDLRPDAALDASYELIARGREYEKASPVVLH